MNSDEHKINHKNNTSLIQNARRTQHLRGCTSHTNHYKSFLWLSHKFSGNLNENVKMRGKEEGRGLPSLYSLTSSFPNYP
jgi:hypothetical protein